ncbi:MAG: Fic family protein [Fimbriimonas sp.]
MASSLHYLTVQDILWVNLQVTKKVHHFNYARLEEATYYQYAYGESNTLVPQAARFLSGFLKLHPFDAGNEATAFVGCLAFLRVNGYTVDLSNDAGGDWLAKIVNRQTTAREALEAHVRKDEGDHHDPDVRAAIDWVLSRYSCSVVDLLTNRPA